MLVTGEVTEEELYKAFKEQAMALAKGGADALCIETMSAADEAAIAIRAARENTHCEVICTFTFQRGAKGQYRTMMGVSPTKAAQEAIQAGAHIVGANCGNGMEQMIEIVKEMRAAAQGTPILVHANAGLPQNVNGVGRFPRNLRKKWRRESRQSSTPEPTLWAVAAAQRRPTSRRYGKRWIDWVSCALQGYGVAQASPRNSTRPDLS